MDIVIICTVIGTGITVIGFMYGIMRNFKADIDKEIKEQTIMNAKAILECKNLIPESEQSIHQSVKKSDHATDAVRYVLNTYKPAVYTPYIGKQ